MPNLVDRDRLNALRFPENPLKPARYTRLCAKGEMAGAVNLGGRWMVDLETFDAAVARAIAAPVPGPRSDEAIDFAERVRRAREAAYGSTAKRR